MARRRPLVFAMFSVSLLFAAVILILRPAFQTNDDAIMCMIASGQGISLAPDEHLVFTNVIIGKLLKTLYTAYPHFMWYGWYLVATQWVVTVAMLYCLLRPRYTRRALFGFYAYFLTAGIYFLVNLQFTATGTIVGITGGLLLVQLLRFPWQSRWEQAALALGAVLFLVWGGLVRSDTLALTLILMSPVLLATCWASAPRRNAVALVSLALISSLGLSFLAARYHADCYSDPEWQAFYEYNPLRLKFNDEQWVEYTPETQHVFAQVGWSEIDFTMIKNWYYDDPQFGRETLSKILTSHSWAHERDLQQTLRVFRRDLLRQPVILAIYLVMSGMLFFLGLGERRTWVCVTAFVVATGILLAIALLRKAPPERVFMPVLAYPWLVVLFSIAPGWRQGNRQRCTLSQKWLAMCTAWHWRHWWSFKTGGARHLALRTISLCIVIGLGLGMYREYRIGREHRRNQANYEKLLAATRPAAGQPERLVLAFGADFPYEFQAALLGKNDYTGMRLFSLGWPQRTPYAEQMKKHFQIETLGQALVTRPEFVLILNTAFYIEVMEYVGQHFSKDVRIVNLTHVPRGSVSRIEAKSASPEKEASSGTMTLLAIPTLKNLGLLR